MSRTINESLALLETSRTNIENALKDKLSDMGGELDGIKISEVAEKINSIEVGGGSGVDLTKTEHMSLTNSGNYRVYNIVDGVGAEVKFTLNIENIQSNTTLFCFYNGIQISNCSESNLKTSGGNIQFNSNKNINFTIEGTNMKPFILFVLITNSYVTSDKPIEVISVPTYAS